MENSPRYKVIVSVRAFQMLAGHVRFLAHKSPAAARNTKRQLLSSIRSLCRMPQRFPFLVAEFLPANKYHKMVVDRRYLVLYQIKGQTVYVDYIVDCRQDYQWLVR